MKIQMKELRNFIRGQLTELKLKQIKEEVSAELDTEQSSVDEQIDTYLVKLEKQSTQDGSDNKLETILARKSLKFLMEADEDKPEAPEGDQAAPDVAPTADKGKKAKVDITRKTNVNPGQFAAHIARLIENYDSLLNVKRTILVRALKYSKENHSAELASQLQEMLEERFGITLGDKYDEEADATSQIPAAIGANAAPGG